MDWQGVTIIHQPQIATSTTGQNAIFTSVLATHETASIWPVDKNIDLDNSVAVTKRVKALAQALDRGTCQFVLLLATFDRSKGWAPDGYRSCTAWLNAQCGMSASAANDRRRVAYALESLPVITQLFKLGELSWSKVRALTRIATTENERELASKALSMSASTIEQWVRQYRNVSTAQDLADENSKANAQYDNRYVHYRFDEQGMVRIYAALPPLEGAAVLKSLARAEDELYNDAHGKLDERGTRGAECGLEHEDAAQRSAPQLRADALSLMALKHMASEDVDVRMADRYQVVIHVDAATLHQTEDNPNPNCACRTEQPLKCHIENGPTIAASTARRLADDCSVLPLMMKHGEPLSIERKSRVWSAPISRSIVARDCHCQFPGCSASRHIQLHHIKHWADGGETSVENGVTLCGFHHRLIHERHYTVEKTALDEHGMLPRRTFNVIGTDGLSMELTAPLKRFRVKRPDGTMVC